MCGRYQSWIEDEELAAIVERERKGSALRYLRRQEVFPGDDLPVLYGGGYYIRAKFVYWGYPMEEKRQSRTVAWTLAGALAAADEMADVPQTPRKTTLVINARAETVLEKRFFREDIQNHRVLIPTSGYYEWDQAKTKYHIGAETLYLCGMTHQFGDTEHVVILTTAPTPGIRSIHDRMPLIVPKNAIESWLYDDHFSREKLSYGNTMGIDEPIPVAV